MENKLDKYILYDNNVTSLFYGYGAETKINSFNQGITNILGVDQGLYEFVMNPFVLLEAIGVTIPNSDHIKHSEDLLNNILDKINRAEKINGEVINFYRADLINKYEEFYLTCPELEKKRLVEKSEEQLRYIDEGQKNDFEDRFISNLNNHENYRSIINRIAVDRAYNYQLKPKDFGKINVDDIKTFKQWLHSSYLMDILHFFDDKMDIACVRGLKYLWNDFKNDKEIKKDLRYKQNTKLMSKHFSLKEYRDLVDIELINSVVLGRWNDDTLMPVLCVTCDPPERVFARISLVKSLIGNAFVFANPYKKKSRDRRNINFSIEKMMKIRKVEMGEVIFLSQDGTVRAHLKVNKVPFLFNIFHKVNFENFLKGRMKSLFEYYDESFYN